MPKTTNGIVTCERLRLPGRERVDGVGDDGRGRDDADQLIDEGERVALEHGPRRGTIVADEHELPSPLAEREEERQQRCADE